MSTAAIEEKETANFKRQEDSVVFNVSDSATHIEEIKTETGLQASELDTVSLVERYSRLIGFFAKRYLHGEADPLLTDEDLHQVGVIALLEADDRFDPSMGLSKSNYISIRVNGAIVDEIRKHMPISRAEAKLLNRRRAAEDKLTQLNKRSPTEDEIAAHLGIDGKDLSKMTSSAYSKKYPVELDTPIKTLEFEDSTLTIGDMTRSDNALTADKIDSRRDIWDAFRDADLTEQEAFVLLRHFVEDQYLGEIGEELGVSESRASQHKSSALKKLRPRLEEHRFAA